MRQHLQIDYESEEFVLIWQRLRKTHFSSRFDLSELGNIYMRPVSSPRSVVRPVSPFMETCCLLCHNVLVSGTKFFVPNNCGHIFHPECIDGHCRDNCNTNCPQCERDMRISVQQQAMMIEED